MVPWVYGEGVESAVALKCDTHHFFGGRVLTYMFAATNYYIGGQKLFLHAAQIHRHRRDGFFW